MTGREQRRPRRWRHGGDVWCQWYRERDVFGTTAPGNSIGNLTVNGTYTQAVGSTYQVELNSGLQSDHIQVNGAAVINGGTVQVLAAPGNYTGGMRYNILTASRGVSGVYSGVTSVGLNRNAQLFYRGNNVFLVTELARAELLASAQTFNERAVMNVLGANNLPPGLQTIYNALLLNSPAQAAKALDELSGAIHGSLLAYAGMNTMLTGQMLYDQLQGTLERPDTCGDPNLEEQLLPCGWNAWMRFRGNLGASSNNREFSGIDTNTFGVLAGLDRWLSNTTRIGFYGNYNLSRVNTQGLNEDGNVSMCDVGVNGSQTFGPWYALGNVGYGRNTYKINRRINFGFDTFSETESSKYNGNLYNSGIEAGRAFTYGDVYMIPFGGVQYLRMKNDDFIESGGNGALRGSKLDNECMWTSFGIRTNYSRGYDVFSCLWRANARFVHNVLGEDRAAVMQFAGGGSPFGLHGPRPPVYRLFDSEFHQVHDPYGKRRGRGSVVRVV
ncbi:MAG: autotransporter domain-containing protein [Planctomycetes bacterium]|nr:autotransporter domain-containing protein [Planctomycetota bacterium]